MNPNTTKKQPNSAFLQNPTNPPPSTSTSTTNPVLYSTPTTPYPPMIDPHHPSPLVSTTDPNGTKQFLMFNGTIHHHSGLLSEINIHNSYSSPYTNTTGMIPPSGIVASISPETPLKMNNISGVSTTTPKDDVSDDDVDPSESTDESEGESTCSKKDKSKVKWTPEEDRILKAAVGAYLYADDPKEFCLEYMLHQKNMREVRKLHRQLLNTVRSELKASALEIDTDETEVDAHEKDETVEFPEPKDEEDEQYRVETAIRQVICAGMVDQVARLATVEDLAHMDVSYKETSRPYVTLSLGRSVPVFIHPGSCLFGRHPEYVVFTELSKSRKNKTYMRGVTAIEPNWISRFGNSNCGFVKFSDPLESPAPFYDNIDDMVKCFVRPTIHQSATGVVWTLPIEPIEFRDGARQISVFAKSILEGKVFEGLRIPKESLVNLPTIIQSKRFLDLTISLKKLFPQGLKCSKAKLLSKWQEDSSFLRKELSNLGLNVNI